MIKAANEAVTTVTKAVSKQKSRGCYKKFTAEQQATVSQYAVMHGNAAAIRHFSEDLGEIKEGTLRGWKVKYLAMLRLKQENDENDLTVKSLPFKKTGRRPLLLGEKLDTKLKFYVKAVREGGGVINTAITMAAAAAIVKKQDRNLLAENGGHIRITKTWAKSFLQRIGYVKRRGSSTAKMTITDFEAVRDQFLFDIKTIVEMEEIPPGLVFNWDQTGISIVPGSAWTMELKGSRKVEIAGMSDKRQITVVISGTMTGELMPFQVIYQGKTSGCLPHKPVKEFMRKKFQEWYAGGVLKQLDEGKEVSPIDLKLSTLKPLGAHWLISLYDYLNSEQGTSIIANGFKAAGIFDIAS